MNSFSLRSGPGGTLPAMLAALLTALLATTGLVLQPATAQTSSSSVPMVTLPDFSVLVDRASPAVVNIRTTARISSTAQRGGGPEIDENDPFYEFFRRFLPPGQQPQPRPGPGPRDPRGERGDRDVPRGVGSGFIISADGFLMTNHHVVDGADEINVTLPDRREFKGKLIGSDRRTDVALVKIEASGLPTLTIGDPGKLKVGEWVIAIGSPFGLDSTVTAGIVSAKARETGDFLPFIQTDVAVNPGNSGGPLINMRGEVVGINSQIFTTSGAFAGISFAIPMDEAMRVQEQLRAQGRVIRGRIGVEIAEVTKDVADAIGLQKPQGALVRRVEDNGPAAAAGVEAGDVILRFDGRSVDRSVDLPRLVGATRPGSKSTLTVWRKGGQRDLQVTIVELQEQRQTARRGDTPPRPATPANQLGLTVVDIPADKLKEMKLRGAVQVESADGAAGRAGVRQGDLIVAINNTDVVNVKQFNDLVAKLDPKRNVALLIRRGDQATFVIIRPSDRG